MIDRRTLWFPFMTWRVMVINAFLVAVGLAGDPKVQRCLLVATAIVVGAIIPFPASDDVRFERRR